MKLDREKAQEVLVGAGVWFDLESEVFDRLEECVTSTPPPAIDRDALVWAISDVLMRVYDNGTAPNARPEAEEVADGILALLRPADGVLLIPGSEDAELVREALDIAQEKIDDYADQFSDVDVRADDGRTRAAAAQMRAIAARMEGAR